MVQPLQVPDLPPEGPWAAYVLVVIWLPFLLRILFLLVPFRKAVYRLLPHTKWAFIQLKELPIRGIGLLAFNETIAFIIPPLTVLGLRLLFDPIGWQTWDEISNTGLALLALGFMIWIFLDFLRIARVRRMMKAIEKQRHRTDEENRGCRFENTKVLVAKLFARKGPTDEPSVALKQATEVANKARPSVGVRRILSDPKDSLLQG